MNIYKVKTKDKRVLVTTNLAIAIMQADNSSDAIQGANRKSRRALKKELAKLLK